MTVLCAVWRKQTSARNSRQIKVRQHLLDNWITRKPGVLINKQNKQTIKTAHHENNNGNDDKNNDNNNNKKQ